MLQATSSLLTAKKSVAAPAPTVVGFGRLTSLLLLSCYYLNSSSVVAIATAVDETATYEFSITTPDNTRTRGRILRPTHVDSGIGKTMSRILRRQDNKVEEANLMDQEEQTFWDRLLSQDDMGSYSDDPDDGSSSNEDGDSTCPTRVEVGCQTTSGIPCGELTAAGNDDDECLVEVVFTYTITNYGSSTEQLYTLVVARGDLTTIVTDIPDAIPTTLLEPGQSITATGEILELDICGPDGLGVFETKADVLAGPPTSVQVQISCESSEGVECREISDTFNSNNNAEDGDDPGSSCEVDVIYTYTIYNTGTESGFNTILFTRERNDEFMDLMPLLGTNVYLDIGETTTVSESERIDRCVDQTFTTMVVVKKLPPADQLCQDTGYYASIS